MKNSTSRMRRLVTARPWLSGGVAVVVAGGSVTAYLLTGHSDAQAQDGVISRLVAASIGTVRQSVSATGTFAPADEEDVSFSSAAEVTSVRVAVGNKVKKGQILGTIDDLALKAALAEARSTLASAQATLATAEDGGTATAAQLSADRAGVSTARRAVTAARDALDDATLRSPISGTVAEVNVADGDQAAGSSAAASGSDSSSGTSADFVVIGMNKWTVSASVDDTEVGLIKKGQQVRITTSNVDGTVFGLVSSVSVLSSSDSGSATYPVDIEITGSPDGLHDGASATVEIIYHQVANVLTVPSTSVHTGTDGKSFVYVDSSGKKVRKDVTAGLSSGGLTQIKSGLREGDQVYIEISTGSSGTSNNGGNQLLQRGNLPAGGVVIPGTGQFPAGGKLPVTSGGGK